HCLHGAVDIRFAGGIGGKLRKRHGKGHGSVPTGSAPWPAVRFLAVLVRRVAFARLGTARLGTARPAGSGRSLCRILASSSTTLFLQGTAGADLALMPGEGPSQQDDDHRQQDEGDERPDPGTGIFRFNPAIT